jgi:phosphopantetheine--protein transferase-like protein
LASRLSDVEICSRDARRQTHRPRIRIGLRPFAGSLSIAHTAKGALAAFTASEQLSVGVDLVDLDEMAVAGDSGGFARLWFTPLERYWVAADRPRRTATLWGIKEAVYKACQSGEAWSPRDVVVWPRTGGYRCTYRGMAINGLGLEIDQVDGHVAVMASLLHIAQINAGAVGGRPSLIAALRRTNVFGDSSQRELILGQAS